MGKVISYLTPILVLGAGLAVMIGGSSLTRSPRTKEVVIFTGFVIFNVIAAFIFRLTHRLTAAWSFRKGWQLPIGFLMGGIPISTAYFAYFLRGELPVYRGLGVLSALLTLVTVGWEELWFRGTALEVGRKRYGKIGAAVIFGAVFAILHVMNPKISIFEDGPQLFLAGYTLTICYFAFGSIWAPIGMHFANNSIQAAYGNPTEPRTIAYIGPLLAIAAALTIVVHYKMRITSE